MFNYLMRIEYDGTKFVGWQYQKNGTSIQEKIEKSLYKIFKKKIRIVGAGRTDKGVHASGQHANFKIEKKINDKEKFLNSINFFLHKDSITIISIKSRSLNFHSRHSAKERVYKYYIINRIGLLSLDKNRAWHIKKKLNLNIMKKGGKILEGTHDFSTFRASSCSAKSAVKKINSVRISKIKDKISITFKSKSFLQNQVRSMVGCLEKLSSDKWDLEKFKKVLQSKKRSNCAPPAPAHGLYLDNVRY
ncbi:MAG: tRNA pseudouridine(38-40) synthase TruA [Pseudomonadota bacterium]|nr:tRNA pseudouridine(38-40) synthase TruA [Pseudomonadota bacterium]